MPWTPFRKLEWKIRKHRILKSRNLLQKYYQNADLWLPPNSTQRQFRFFLQGFNKKIRVLKIKDRIHSITVLRKLLVKYTPLDVYYTTSCWLDPQNLGPRSFKKKSKPGYEFASNCYLYSELYFDIDAPGDFSLAKKETLRLVNFLQREYNFQDIKVVFSGGKGFNVYVYDFKLENFVPKLQSNPTIRESQAQDIKLKIVEKILHKYDILIDAPITLDTRRIIRLPMTIHGESKKRCEFVDIDKIQNFKPISLKELVE